ncbi:MAG: sugar ABC transporter substrate-binding protein [Oscillospiraceae bacterium]|jgi:ABC-type sugar transport system substrate-binding protein
MKKTLSVLVVLSLLFSFALLVGCSKKEEPAGTQPGTQAPTEKQPAEETEAPANESGEVTKEMLESSKPNEYVPEKLDAGMEVIVAFNPTDFNGIGGPQNERLKAELEPIGITYMCTCWESDTAKQIQQIENWVTMGAAAIIVHTADPAAIKDSATAAEEAGTSMIFYGTEPQYFCSGITSVNLDALGYSSALIARAWLDERYPDAAEGSIKVAAYGLYLVTDVGVLSDAIRRGITDDPRCEIVYSNDDCTGIDKGYTATQEAFTTNPDIKLVASYDLYAAFGASNYIMSLPGVNPDDYCVVGTTANESLPDFINSTLEGKAVFRGTTTGDDDPAAGMLECIDALLFRGEEKPYYFIEPLHTLTSFDFDYESYFAEHYVPKA